MTSYFKPIYPRIVLAFLALLVGAAILVMIQEVRTFSHSKTQPYEVTISLEAEADNHVFFAFDYGWGIIDRNIHKLELTQANQNFNFSVSAWKPVHAIYVFAPKKLSFSISSLTVVRDGSVFQPNISNIVPILEGENWLYRFSLENFNS